MKCLILALVLLKSITALNAPTAELRTAQENGWELVGRPDPGHLVRLTFAVKQHNPDWLKDKLRAVSYPDSPQYTNYMNFDEIAEHVYGEPESVKAVTRALESMEAQKIDFTIGKDFIIALVPFENVEEYFHASMKLFSRGPNEVTIATEADYILPSELQGHVDFVSGIKLDISFMNTKVHNPTNTGVNVTPEYITQHYNTDFYLANSPNNSQAVAGLIGQYFSQSDLKAFQAKFGLPLKKVVKIVGKNDEKKPGSEANLDIQYICGIGSNVNTWFISVSSSSENPFLKWIVDQVNTTDSPWVHSVSYGGPEPAQSEYIDRIDNEFMKFGISGRSVLFASGDFGVGCGKTDAKFAPEWPTSSPHVTAVGGTTTSMDTVWTHGGGGFSNHFPIPDYQKEIVEEYLKNADIPSSDKFNANGRAYPDLSAFATNFQIIMNGVIKPQDGTSCSAPTVAGLISLLNDLRLNKRQKTLGFLNPLLYDTLKGNGFFDVTEGDNGNGICEGFKAIKGWDPASGWGSPNFRELRDLI